MKPTGRPRVYCTPACRKAAYEDRRAHRDSAVQVQVVERVVTEVRGRRIEVPHPRSDYEEADLIEEWCDEASGDDPRVETQACLDWLRTDRDGSTYQELLKNPQSHSMIRRAMRQQLRKRNRA